MATIRNNERSFVINLISDINQFLSSTTMTIRKCGGEISVTDQNTLFPDLILYRDVNRTDILQGWEVKLPETPLTDQALVENAQQKALMLNLNSFVLWNFNNGVMYIRNNDNSFKIDKSWTPNEKINNKDSVNQYYGEVLGKIKEIIVDINEYINTGIITSNNIGSVLSQDMIPTIINKNKERTGNHLFQKSKRNNRLLNWLSEWWDKYQLEYINDETNMYLAYSKVLLLNWTNKVVYAHLIKRYHNSARRVDEITHETTINQANIIFNEITNACDFYSIFSQIEYNSLIPEESWLDIVALNLFLGDKGIEYIDQSVLQDILENSVNISKREIRGQYATPKTLAEILSEISIDNWESPVIDPCCGTGTIAQYILNRKINLTDIQNAYETLWASDKYSFPLQIANIALANANAMNIPSRIFKDNVFGLFQNKTVPIINPNDGSMANLPIPLFGCIVSNLPFVSSAKIAEDDREYINQVKNFIEENGLAFKDKRADLYAYIILYLWNILLPDGFLGVITSNSWLATNWGNKFREVLLRFFNLKKIVISGAGKWFSNADIVTTLLVLQKKEISVPDDNNMVYFSLINKSLAEMNENDIDITIRSLVLNNYRHPEQLRISSYTYSEINELENEFHICWNAFFHEVHWLSAISEKLCPIKDIFHIIRGSRRGWNRMFYPKNHTIENEYIIKGIKSTSNVDTLIIVPDFDVFSCGESKEELKRMGHLNALSWIERFEGGYNTTGEPLIVTLETARKKSCEKYWYHLSPTYSVADFISSLNPGNRLFVSRFSEPTFLDQRLFGLKSIDDAIDIVLLHALLNTVLSMFFIESIGFGRGQGALDLSKERFAKMTMLNPQLIDDTAKEAIKEAFQPILERQIYPTEREIHEHDRERFDHIVLEAYGIDQHYDAIKESLLSMQSARLSV